MKERIRTMLHWAEKLWIDFDSFQPLPIHLQLLNDDWMFIRNVRASLSKLSNKASRIILTLFNNNNVILTKETKRHLLNDGKKANIYGASSSTYLWKQHRIVSRRWKCLKHIYIYKTFTMMQKVFFFFLVILVAGKICIALSVFINVCIYISEELHRGYHFLIAILYITVVVIIVEMLYRNNLNACYEYSL